MSDLPTVAMVGGALITVTDAPQITAGISRNMSQPPAAAPTDATPGGTGGGDLNGTASLSIMHGQTGTAGVQIAVPRLSGTAGLSGTGTVSPAPLPPVWPHP